MFRARTPRMQHHGGNDVAMVNFGAANGTTANGHRLGNGSTIPPPPPGPPPPLPPPLPIVVDNEGGDTTEEERVSPEDAMSACAVNMTMAEVNELQAGCCTAWQGCDNFANAELEKAFQAQQADRPLHSLPTPVL